MYVPNSDLEFTLKDNNIFKGAIGVTIELTVYEKNKVRDISTASVMKFIFKKPDDTVIERTAEFTTDGKDGKLKYTTTLGDFDVAGNWEVQAYFVIGTFQGNSSIASFTVNENLKK